MKTKLYEYEIVNKKGEVVVTGLTTRDEARDEKRFSSNTDKSGAPYKIIQGVYSLEDKKVIR